MAKGMETQTTSQESEPWGPQQQYLKFGWEQAQNLFNDPRSYFPGQQVAPQSEGSMMAQQGGIDLMGMQNPGYDYVNRLMSGEFLSPDSNPYLQEYAQMGAEDITRNYQRVTRPGASLEGYGRSDSGLQGARQYDADRALGDTLQRHFGGIYQGEYGRERGFMQQAPGMYNQLQGNQRANLAMGQQLGFGADQYGQRQIDADMQRFNFYQNEPGQRLQQYNQSIYGGGILPGLTTTQQTMPGQPFGIGQGIGAGLGALSMIPQFYQMCSRAYKDELDTADHAACLEALKTLPLAIWRYKEEWEDAPDHVPHMGPYAEDFQQALGLGDGKTISFIDVIGFALAATKGAGEKIKALEERCEQLEKVVAMIPGPMHTEVELDGPR